MLSAERKQYINRRLNEKGIIHVKNISNELVISQTTIRRDLIEMEKTGLCKRVHGGAIKNHGVNILSDESELTMIEKSNLFNHEKDVIAQEAARLVKDGDCVFLDGGTSIAPMIKYLAHKRIKIVTHSDLVIREIKNSEAEIFVIGGKYVPKYAMTIGPIAYDTIRQFNFDVAFIGCTGVSVQDGTSFTAEIETRSIKEIAINNALKNYLLIDNNKLQVRGFSKLVNLNVFDGIICNKGDNVPEEVPSNWIWIDE
jgi:DeoR/GlpR family transcriptional regulator of sugar metabolism